MPPKNTNESRSKTNNGNKKKSSRSLLKATAAVVAALSIGAGVYSSTSSSSSPSPIAKLLGFEPQHIGHAIEVATHMGAKIACSARFISHYSPDRIAADLLTYSPVNAFISLEYDDINKRVKSNLYGFAPITAQFYPATGCSLVFEEGKDKKKESNINANEKKDGSSSFSLFNIKKPTALMPPRRPQAEWPMGDSVANSIDPITQRLVEEIAEKDNQQQQQESQAGKGGAGGGGGLHTRALLVVKNGKLVAEYYYNNKSNTAATDDDNVNADDVIAFNTPLLGWSMGKSVLSMLIGRLMQKEKELLPLLNNNDDEKKGNGFVRTTLDMKNLFSQWSSSPSSSSGTNTNKRKNDPRSNITLEEMLQMRSGLDFNEAYVPGADATTMLFSVRSAADYAMRSPIKKGEEVGENKTFYYSSGTTNLLSRFLSNQIVNLLKRSPSSSSSVNENKKEEEKEKEEDVMNPTQATIDFLHRELFAPLAMHDSIFETDPSGNLVGSSYLYASARDWARLGYLMLRRGKGWGGEGEDGKGNKEGDKQQQQQQLLSTEWIKGATAPNPSQNDIAYGYQFWLNRGEKARWPGLPSDSFAMHGNREQIVMVIPSKNVVIVRLGWTKTSYPTGTNFAKLLD